jgi:hypothetical protein
MERVKRNLHAGRERLMPLSMKRGGGSITFVLDRREPRNYASIFKYVETRGQFGGTSPARPWIYIAAECAVTEPVSFYLDGLFWVPELQISNYYRTATAASNYRSRL